MTTPPAQNPDRKLRHTPSVLQTLHLLLISLHILPTLASLENQNTPKPYKHIAGIACVFPQPQGMAEPQPL